MIWIIYLLTGVIAFIIVFQVRRTRGGRARASACDDASVGRRCARARVLRAVARRADQLSSTYFEKSRNIDVRVARARARARPRTSHNARRAQIEGNRSKIQ